MSNTNPFVFGSGSSSGPSVPGGLHPGVCVGVFHIGTQVSPIDGKANPKVVLQFELPEQPMVKRDGRPEEPRYLSKTFTASLGEKANLRKFVKSWFGKDFSSKEAANAFDVSKLLGRAGNLNVVHDTRDGNTYANIDTISPTLPSQKVSAKTHPVMFTVTQLDHPDDLKAAELPEWLEKKVVASEEWKKLISSKPDSNPGEPDFSDDPFA